MQIQAKYEKDAGKRILCNGKIYVVGKDGALYFLTGGRRLESALYRVTYNGDLKHEVIPLTENRSGKKERALRKKIERLQLEKDARKIDFLIQTKDGSLYVCEIKFKKYPLNNDIIKEVKEKIKKVSNALPKHK